MQTKRFLTEEEINKAKADKSRRDEIKAKMEESMGKGQLMVNPVDHCEEWERMRNRLASEDAIRMYCYGIGDLNPLYTSRDYAKNSIYGGIIAPPHFLIYFATFAGVGRKATVGLDFVTAGMEAGCQAEWFQIIREGDEFTVLDLPTEVVDLTREDTALQFLVRGKRIYKNQRDEVVSVFTQSSMAIALTQERLITGVKKRQPKLRHFSEKEVEEWYQLAENEEVRGSNPRYWEDVNVGDELPPTHHVFTQMEYLAQISPSWWRGSWRLRMRQTNGAWRNQLNPESGLPDFDNIHMTDAAAQREGMIRANGAGVQMKTWLGRLVTNWMSDRGFLKKMEDRLRRPLYRESSALIKGQVVKKYIEGDEHLVDLHISLEDHNGDFVIPDASATVVLPSRHATDWKPTGS